MYVGGLSESRSSSRDVLEQPFFDRSQSPSFEWDVLQTIFLGKRMVLKYNASHFEGKLHCYSFICGESRNEVKESLYSDT